jgi:hypothetical protein
MGKPSWKGFTVSGQTCRGTDPANNFEWVRHPPWLCSFQSQCLHYTAKLSPWAWWHGIKRVLANVFGVSHHMSSMVGGVRLVNWEVISKAERNALRARRISFRLPKIDLTKRVWRIVRRIRWDGDVFRDWTDVPRIRPPSSSQYRKWTSLIHINSSANTYHSHRPVWIVKGGANWKWSTLSPYLRQWTTRN